MGKVLGSVSRTVETPGLVIHGGNHSTLEVEAGGSKVQGHSQLHGEFKASLCLKAHTYTEAEGQTRPGGRLRLS